MSECASLNEVQLRREARRRKILENSETRLRSITGKGSDNFQTHNHISDNHFRDSRFEFGYENRNDNLTRDFGHSFPSKNEALEDSDNAFRANFINRFEEETEGKGQVQVKRTFINSLIQKRFHYAILSIIVHFLLICKLGSFFYDNLFCPFITVKLMEFMLVREHVQTKQANLLSLMTSIIKGSTIAYIYKIVSVIGTAISDFMFYIFFLILSDKLYSAVTEIPSPLTILSNKQT